MIRVLLRGRQEGQIDKYIRTEAVTQRKDALLLALKLEGRAMTEQCKWPLEAGISKEMDSPGSLQKECSPADTLISDFRPPELEENKIVWFEANDL